MDIIKTLEFWQMDAARIAVLINTTAKLRSMSLMGLFQAAVAAGADPAEFRTLWGYQEFIRRIEAALQAGDLAGVQALLATNPVDLSPGTLAAVQQVIAANTLTRLQANWPEFDEQGNPAPEPPTSVDAAWVEEQLTAAGYTWDSTARQWEKKQ